MRHTLLLALCALMACDGKGGGGGGGGGGVTESPDTDGDGSPDYLDCAPEDPDTSPLASEVCDAVDNDCDGDVDEDAIDAATWYADEDGDGIGVDAYPTLACEAPEDTSAVAGDCDDEDDDVSPIASEVCGGGDEDCDGEIDEEDALRQKSYFADNDGDGFGDPDTEITGCDTPAGFVLDDDDCDDADPAVNPAETERCDGLDQDCDGRADDGAHDVTWYADSDGDGYGGTSTTTCYYGVSGYSPTGGDCDDHDALSWPGAEEQCDGDDNDCDGVVDDEIDEIPVWYADGDGDGYGDVDGLPFATCTTPAGYADNLLDCDDGDGDVHPEAVEQCSNGVDDDCDGLLDPCAPITVNGGTAGDYLGWAMLGGQDWDGDGVNDALFSAYLANSGGSDSGRVYRLDAAMSEDLDLGSAAVLTGTKGVELGAGLAAAGDLNGDGYPELLVGGTGESTGGSDAGAAWLIAGPLDESSTLEDGLGVVRGASAGDGLGRALSAGGDLDGDGLADLALGSPDSDLAYTDGGAVWVYSGAWTGDETAGDSAAAILLAEADGDDAGRAIDLGGDLDGDGLADLAVGAPNRDVAGCANSGAVYVLYGPLSGTLSLTDADEVVTGDRYGQAGYALDLAGDLSGDGLDDLLVGSRHDSRSADQAGAATLLSGPVASGEIRASGPSWYGDSASDMAGTSVSAVGDLDGDGQPELAFGGPEDTDGGVDAGAVWIVYGPVWTSEVSLKVTGPAAGAALGLSLGATGDLSADGLDDLLLGAPKASALVSKGGAILYISGF